MVVIEGWQLSSVPLEGIAGKTKTLDPTFIKQARGLLQLHVRRGSVRVSPGDAAHALLSLGHWLPLRLVTIAERLPGRGVQDDEHPPLLRRW